MHYGSGSGSGPDLDPDTIENGRKSKKKIKETRPTFWEKMLLLQFKGQEYVLIFLGNYAKCCLDPEPEQEPNPDPKLFQSRNRNRNAGA